MRWTPFRLKHSGSTKNWLARQFKDPFVRKRFEDPAHYRSRAAYKLLDIDSMYKILDKPDVRAVVDLGAAPGSWSQVAAAKVGTLGLSAGPERAAIDQVRVEKRVLRGEDFGLREDAKSAKAGKEAVTWSGGDIYDFDVDNDAAAADVQTNAGRDRGGKVVIALDRLRIPPIRGVYTLQMDFLGPDAAPTIASLLPDGKADVILSDMAANASGFYVRDSAMSLEICEAVYQFTERHLRTAREVGRDRAGVLVLKHFVHPVLTDFRKTFLEPNFRNVFFVKPEASRKDSTEAYWVCLGWKGVN
ncbi:23S ribosomal RNA methyltransferase [Rickenella mellea]|uniref:rRNA methyltransferase 2, mitochondrial n=1 Tax=Rickenella mellea TaxID=50990 RepID=A0A4Y7QHB3_9AGAM|nr:23S ribosomal RNA methyltransferase [Rickenella mellea]